MSGWTPATNKTLFNSIIHVLSVISS